MPGTFHLANLTSWHYVTLPLLYHPLYPLTMSQQTEDQFQLLRSVLPCLISSAITLHWIPEQDISARAFWAELIPQLQIIERLLDAVIPTSLLDSVVPVLECLEQLISSPSNHASQANKKPATRSNTRDYPILRHLQLEMGRGWPISGVKPLDIDLSFPASDQGRQVILDSFYSLTDEVFKTLHSSPHLGSLETSSPPQSGATLDERIQYRNLVSKLGNILRAGIDCNCPQRHYLIIYPPVLSKNEPPAPPSLRFIASLEQKTRNWIQGMIHFSDGGE